MLERADRGDPEQRGRPRPVVGAQHLGQLRRGPHRVAPLLALAVRVERRGEAALRGAQVGDQEVAGLLRDPPPERMAGGPPPMEVRPGEQRVVVQHLLEVRDDPVGVDGVPGEAAGQLVVDPAARHRLEGPLGHREGVGVPGARVVAQQVLQRHRRRELRRAPEPAAGRVVRRGQRPHRLGELGLVRGASLGQLRGHGLRGREVGHQPLARDQHVRAPLAPGPVDGLQHLGERRRAVVRPWREVRAGVERLGVGREEHRHRPATVAVQLLHRGHVDGVDVGPLLAVDLDVDEGRVHHRGGRRCPRTTRAPSRGTSGTRSSPR